MPGPPIVTVRDQIAWTYANLARAHAALGSGRTRYVVTDHMVRARLFKGLTTGTMAMGSIYQDERLKQLAERQCAYCNCPDRLTIDHLIPRVAGGSDDGVNLVLCCRSCNSSKGSSDVLIWFGRREVFPPLLLLRRYLKIVAAWCDRAKVLDAALDDPALDELPFAIAGLRLHYPALAEMRL